MPDGTSYTILGKKNLSTEVISPATPAPDPVANPQADFTTVYSKLCGVVGGGEEIGVGGGNILVFDEGNIIARTVTTLNFVGLNIEATSPDNINVTITVLDQAVRDEGVQKTDFLRSFDFVGGGVTLTADANGNCTVSIPEDAILSVFGRTGVIVSQDGDYVLDQMGDVVVTNPQTGEAIVFDGAIWRNQVVSTVGSLDDLIDVTLTSPQVGDVLAYNGVIWINNPSAGGGGVQFLNDLLDVTAPSPLDAEILVFELATQQWVSKTSRELAHDLILKVQLTEQGTDTLAVFDGVKTIYSMRDWDDNTRAITVENDSAEAIWAGIEGLYQEPRKHYTVLGSQITFVTPPPVDATFDIRAFTIPSLLVSPSTFLLIGDGSNLLLGDGTSILQTGEGG
jgi:hypothetical protein